MPSKTIVAMICITALLIIALLKGIDGVLLASGMAALTGLGGYELHKKLHP